MTDTPAKRALFSQDHPRYRWVGPSNTTLGMLMATINSSIVAAIASFTRGKKYVHVEEPVPATLPERVH